MEGQEKVGRLRLSRGRLRVSWPSLEALGAAFFLLGCVVAAQNLLPGEIRISSRPYSAESEPAIRVETKLVPVGVVVRDLDDNAVAGLKQSDFQVFDNGKPQRISAFSTESASATTTQDVPSPRLNPTSPPSPPKLPPTPRYIAFYFDDLHTGMGDIDHARAAAQIFMRQGFTRGDVVGVFTSSGSETLNFTADVSKVDEILAGIRPHPRSSIKEGETECPRITPHAAYVIANQLDPSLLASLVQEGVRCDCGSAGGGSCMDMERSLVQSEADRIWELSREQSQDTLEVLRQIVRLLIPQPGRRSLLIVSSGFITGTAELGAEQDSILTEAVHAGVVINALDAKGLFSEAPNASGDGDLKTAVLEQSRMLIDMTDAMAILAEGTGGRFITNNNDLTHGFRELAGGPQFSYLLGFVPEDLKANGSFHKLTVKVTAKGHFNIEARRSYMDPTKEQMEHSDPTRRLNVAVFAADELMAIPTVVKVDPQGSGPDKGVLRIAVRVDPSKLVYQRQKDRNVQRLTFVAVLFDANGRFIAGEESVADLALTDSTLHRLKETGISARAGLHAPPGRYKLREVVQDAIEGKLSAITLRVEIR